MAVRLCWILIVQSIILTGCGTSLLTNPKENPVIENQLGLFNFGPVATLAMTPERRVVLVNVNTNDRNGTYGKFCAEPPADVAESLSSTFQAALEARLPELGVNAAGELGRALSTAAQLLAQRSQGLQLYRAGSFTYCAMLLNGWLTPDQFVDAINNLTVRSVDLITFELDKNDGKIGHAVVPPLGAPELEAFSRSFAESLFKNLRSDQAPPTNASNEAPSQ